MELVSQLVGFDSETLTYLRFSLYGLLNYRQIDSLF